MRNLKKLQNLNKETYSLFQGEDSGESLNTQQYQLHIKKIKTKIILYTLSKMISAYLFLFLIEDFYRVSIS